MKKTLFTVIVVFSVASVSFLQVRTGGTLADAAVSVLIEADDYDSKRLLLEYVEFTLANDPTGKSVMETLSRLVGDSVWTLSQAKGRLLNDYADIRERACTVLGRIATEESKNILLRSLHTEKNVQVLTSAIRSLTAICSQNMELNDNDDVITAIIQVQHTNAVLYQTRPSDRLALESLASYEKLATSVQNKNAMIQSLFSMCTNYHYSINTRKRANAMLRSIIMK
jgi:HEAT repeat protein